jgi:hypothetical protein
LRESTGSKKPIPYLETYRPRLNKPFSVLPSHQEDMHRPAPSIAQLHKTLCIESQRALRNDFTVFDENKLYQIKDHLRTREVTVEVRLDGSLHLSHQGKSLIFQAMPTRPVKTFSPRKMIKTKKTRRRLPFHNFIR